MSDELDIESQNVISVVSAEKLGSWRIKRKWRLVSVVVQLVHNFSVKNSKPDNEIVPLLTGTCDDRDVEMTSISTSTQAHSRSEFDQAGRNHNNDIHQHYANMAIITKNKDLNSLNQYGGVKGFADTVGIDLEQGLPSGLDHNIEPVQVWPQSDTVSQLSDLIHILKNTCNKYNLMLILLSAILLLILGIIEKGWETGWYQGVLIFLAILFLITVSVTCKYWLLLRWAMTNTQSSNVPVNVLREGQPCMIPLSKVGLGDIVYLNVGEEVLVDGLFVKGESLRLDEESLPTISDQNPFVFCGSKVIHGEGQMMVTAVGKDTVLGEMKSQIKTSTTNKTSLQLQLNKLNTWMQCIALVVANLLIIVTLLRYTFDKAHDHPGSPDLKRESAAMKEFIDLFEEIITKNEKIRKIASSLTMIILGFSEGMPLMVTLAIGYWNKKASSDKATTQDFVACVTAGSINVICTEILDGTIQCDVEELDVYIGEERITEKSNIDRHVCKALCDGIGFTISELQRPITSMEHALLSRAPVKLGLEINNTKDQYRIIDVKELVSSEVSGLLIKNIVDQNTQDSHWNGPPMKILPMCSHYYDSAGEKKPLVGRKRDNIEAIVENVRITYPKSIAFGYKPNTPQLEETDLIWIGTVGLKHPFRKPMEAFVEAGVTVKLVSKRNVPELKTTALQCGLNISNVDTDHSVILGDQFREYTHEQRIEIVDKICIMGNSLQSDKLLMVKCLKEKGHRVLMVGMESDDVPSLLESDLGISMGECFTEAVKGSSKIVITQGNFRTLLSIVKFGRCARENIQNFIRIELTMAFAWSLINIISTSCSGDSPITSIQFFWISLIVPFFGGLAILIMWPNDVLMKKTLERRTETIVPRTMWRSIAVEVIYQTTILVTFQYEGAAVLGITSKEVVATMMFNSFVLCQAFSWFNAREMKEKSVLSEISRNCWFWVAIGVTLALQVTYTEIANIIAKNARLNLSQWGVCFLIGGASSVVDLLNKCISDLPYGLLLFKQQCYITKSPCMSRSPSSSGPPSLIGIPLLEDDPRGLVSAIDSIQA